MSDNESEDGEEGDYTVYECPGLAPVSLLKIHESLACFRKKSTKLRKWQKNRLMLSTLILLSFRHKVAPLAMFLTESFYFLLVVSNSKFILKIDGFNPF